MTLPRNTVRIATIVTHNKPHFDEIVAMWFLKRFGNDIFPGISDAKIMFVNNFNAEFCNKTAEDLEKQGILCVGIGNGQFDEHLQKGYRKKNQCAATLVLSALQIDKNDPQIKQMIEYTLMADTRGDTETSYSIATMVKSMHTTWDTPFVVKWTEAILEAKLEQQTHFIDAVSKFKKHGQTCVVTGPKGPLTIAWIKSDNLEMHKAVRWKETGCNNPAVFIQQKSTGHIQIFPNTQRNRFSITDTVKLIRIAEQKKYKRLITTDWTELGSAGSVPGAEMWYFAKESGKFLFNGCNTSYVEPTVLSLEEVVDIVKIGISPSTFNSDRKKTCQSGQCVSSRKNQCPLYPAGLHRCTSMRFDAHHARKIA